MPKITKTRVKCPKSEHTDTRVKLDGTYGKPGHRRQRYKCTPDEGKPHVFTELLPREEAWHGDCDQCERHLERREGPKAPRHYQFVARGIAEALVAVGAGDTYMQASRVARDRARRFRFDPLTGEVRESADGQLVADWVELFAPVLYEPDGATAWPVEGSCGSITCLFRVGDENENLETHSADRASTLPSKLESSSIGRALERKRRYL